jgi:hypothetical protein
VKTALIIRPPSRRIPYQRILGIATHDTGVPHGCELLPITLPRFTIDDASETRRLLRQYGAMRKRGADADTDADDETVVEFDSIVRRLHARGIVVDHRFDPSHVEFLSEESDWDKVAAN